MSAIIFDEGVYKAKITDWGLAKARTGNNQLVIKFKPIGMVDPSEPDAPLQPCPDYERSVYRVITEKSIDFVLEDLELLGYDKNGFEFLDRNHAKAHNFEGQEIEVRCFYDEWQGQQKEKWELNRGGGAARNQLDASEMQKMNAMFGKHFAKLSKKPSTPSRVPSNAPKHGEEIPF